MGDRGGGEAQERMDPEVGGDPFDVHRYRASPGRWSGLVAGAQTRQWDPYDDAVVDLRTPFDTRTEPVMPLDWFPELRTPAGRALPHDARVRVGNEIIRWLLSGILHGEQAAVHVAAQLCDRFADPEAQAFAAIQAREETRHVAAFSRYLHARWGQPYPLGDAFGRFLREILRTTRIERKVVGIGLVVEGFAMGAFANIHAHTLDPALRHLMRALMRDEAAHHGFALEWIDRELPGLDASARRTLDAWGRKGAMAMRLNLVSVRQRQAALETAGVDWQRMRRQVADARKDPSTGPGPEENINPLRHLEAAVARLTGEDGNRRDTDD